MSNIPTCESGLVQRIGRFSEQPFRAVAVLCGENWDDDTNTVTGYLSHKEVSPRFCHAIEMERAYCDALLSFDEIALPEYGNSVSIDLVRMAAEIGVARVYCVVVMGIDDAVTGWRDLAGVEATVLEAIVAQLTSLQVMLGRRINTAPTIKRVH